MYTAQDHTFAICAYKDNPYLENTIRSLEAQTLSSAIILSTSTPSPYIQDICSRHGIPITINEQPNHAGDDWNHAYDSCSTKLVTIVHQDDYYELTFLERTLDALNAQPRDDVMIVFTDYYEMRPEGKVTANLLLAIKRLMNAPMRGAFGARCMPVRQRILAFGCPICCPSVTYVKTHCGDTVFDTTYINSCDYKTYVDLSFRRGAFVYVPKMLMGHRIYAESATSRNLGANIRKGEDQEILELLWPRPIARAINAVYATSERSNDL